MDPHVVSPSLRLLSGRGLFLLFYCFLLCFISFFLSIVAGDVAHLHLVGEPGKKEREVSNYWDERRIFELQSHEYHEIDLG